MNEKLKDLARFNSVEKKLVIPILLFTLALFILVVGASIKINTELVREQIDSKGASMARYMAKTSKFYYYNYDLGALDGFVKEVIKDPAVVFAVYYDEEGKPVTMSSEAPADKSNLLVYEEEITGDEGRTLGRLSLGYSLASLNESRNRILLTLGIVTLLALFGMIIGNSLAVRKLITTPLNRAVEVANRLSEGDLTVKVPPGKKDEIGQLLEAMDNMVEKLKTLMTQLSTSAREVNESSNIISRSVQSQAVISTQQSSSVAEITSTMEELSASSTEIANHSGSVVDIAAKTLEDTKKGALSFEDFIAKMSEIQEDNETSIKEILELGSKSKEITKVMEIINNIADQTKLIAFNAALEASSAGEAGKRFGVVAAEIRRLAESVTESTGEIETKINEIQEAINRLVVSSEKGSKGIQEGMDYSMQTGELLSDIVGGAESTSTAARQISISTQQQKTASEQVVASIREIAEGAKTSSDSINQITERSTLLADLSENLKEVVDQFRLSSNGGDPSA